MVDGVDLNSLGIDTDYNFVPGDRVIPAVMQRFRNDTHRDQASIPRGIVVCVDGEQHMCYVMWTLVTGQTKFSWLPNYGLRHDR